jgi:hypothetical protein
LYKETFDIQIQRAIYALPTFDSVDNHLIPAAIHLPRKMHPSMTKRLILSKMDAKDSGKRPLCLAITRAVVYLDNQFEMEASLRLDFIEALAERAARTLTLYSIADGLVAIPTVDCVTQSLNPYFDSTPQDALIATLSTRRFHLAIKLLKEGVNTAIKSHAFGVPLRVAGAMGAQEFLQIALEGLVGQDKGVKKARRVILESAVAGGYKHLVQMILDNPENNRERLGERLSPWITLAIESGHKDVALLLLRRRTPISLRESLRESRLNLESQELGFWQNLSEVAKRHSCEDILRIASESVAHHQNDKLPEQEQI